MDRICKLTPLIPSLKLIDLKDSVPTVIGRSPETEIKEEKISRRQIVATADVNNCVVSIKPIGQNPSGLDGFVLEKDVEITAKHGSVVELMINSYPYMIQFDPPPVQKKANLSDDSISEIPSKRMKKIEGLPPNPALMDSFQKIDNGLLYVFTTKGVISSSKIAAYDLDGTLIKTKSGNVFPKNDDDWEIIFPEVPGVLKKNLSDGFKICVFTNQSSIGRGKSSPEAFKNKVKNIFSRIGVPVQVFISTSKGKYRKPCTGMWNALCEMNDNIDIDKHQSFYCGDALGRIKDHSFVDRFFAENLGLKLYTPEYHFKGVPMKNNYQTPSFNITSLDRSKNPNFIKELIQNVQEIAVMVGFPGCGKSTLSLKIKNDSKGKYDIVCQDVLKNLPKCKNTAELMLKNKKSVIIDRTNLTLESRKIWIDMAKNFNVKCRCIWLDISFGHCQHNNVFRELTDKNHTIVTMMTYNTLKRDYMPPTVNEGFWQINKVKFYPEFTDKNKEDLYFQHLVEK